VRPSNRARLASSAGLHHLPAISSSIAGTVYKPNNLISVEQLMAIAAATSQIRLPLYE
jgi:hypothetical protein